MKFTDGYWLSREGYTSLCPAQAYDAQGNSHQVHRPDRSGPTPTGLELRAVAHYQLSLPSSAFSFVRTGTSKRLFSQKPDGGVWQTDLWQAGMGIVDFTNPEARAWYAAKLDGLVDLGADSRGVFPSA